MILSYIKSKYDNLVNIDKNEKVINFAQTIQGKFLLCSLFSSVFLLIKSVFSENLLLTWVVLLCTFLFAYLPKQRHRILILGLVGVLCLNPFWYGLDYIIHMFIVQNVSATLTKTIAAIALVFFLLCAFGTLTLAKHKKNLFIVKYPIRSMLLIIATLYFSSFFYFNIYVVVFISSLFFISKSYIWYFAYALAETKLKKPPPLVEQIGNFKNFWCALSGSIPVGKGSHYLNSKLAKDNRELAITQLKAIKLIVWSVIVVQFILSVLVYIMSYYHIEKIEYYQLMTRNGHTFPIVTGWLSLIYSVTYDALKLCVGGNTLVAVARFAGFYLPRFMYKPLSSRTLVDFWNRYHYYFKELLVDIFFMPTFLKYFKKHPKMRLVFATFMAAGVGNFIFHFLKYCNLLYLYDIAAYSELFYSYAFYCVLLTIGICVSQLRINSGIKPKNDLFSRVNSFICVWGFVVLVYLFGNESLAFEFMERVKFMGILIGVNL